MKSFKKFLKEQANLPALRSEMSAIASALGVPLADFKEVAAIAVSAQDAIARTTAWLESKKAHSVYTKVMQRFQDLLTIAGSTLVVQRDMATKTQIAVFGKSQKGKTDWKLKSEEDNRLRELFEASVAYALSETIAFIKAPESFVDQQAKDAFKAQLKALRNKAVAFGYAVVANAKLA